MTFRCTERYQNSPLPVLGDISWSLNDLRRWLRNTNHLSATHFQLQGD
jgi:hypothetical protein